MDRSFSRWRPGMPPAPGGSLKPALDSIYDLDGVSMGADGFTFTMVPDGLRRWELAGQKILLTWEYILAFQITQETYREDCWVSQPEDAWSLLCQRLLPSSGGFPAEKRLLPRKGFPFPSGWHQPGGGYPGGGPAPGSVCGGRGGKYRRRPFPALTPKTQKPGDHLPNPANGPPVFLASQREWDISSAISSLRPRSHSSWRSFPGWKSPG